MVRRHPHVFGDVEAKNSAAVLKNWERIKAEERAAEAAGSARSEKGLKPQHGSVLGGVPRSLPGVLEAYQLTRRASHIGFDWDNLQQILEKLEEEMGELQAVLPARSANGKPRPKPTAQLEEEAGDLLFTAVNVARFLGVDPEIALKKANRKFKQRFNWMEAVAVREGSLFADLARERMEELWNESKASTPAPDRAQ